MGILDILQGNYGAASPWNALYQDPLAQRQQAADSLLASMGVSPTAAPQISPFDLPQPPAPAARPSPFGAGAAPFSFAGPGSMSVQSSQIAPPASPPAPAPAPAVAAAPAPVATDISSSNAEPQASPIAVGNYMMPRVGAADDFEPEDSTPANASPTQGRVPGAPQVAPLSLGGAPAVGVGDRLGASLQSFANTDRGGLLGKLANGVSSLVTGQRSDPTGIALGQQAAAVSANAQALLAKGADPYAVRAAAASYAAGDPKPLGALFTQYFGADKFQHVTRKGGPLEGEQVGSYDPTTGKYTWDGGGGSGSPAAGGGVQAMVDSITQARNNGASRADLIKRIPSQYQGYITGLLDGKAVPANIGRGQERGALMMLAHAVDGNFDETMIPARITTATDFTPKGKSGASIVAFNTVQHHIGKLSDDFEALGNAGQGGFAALNAFRNATAANTPFDPVRQKAVQAVNDDLKAVSDEMSAAYKAGHVSDTEIKSWNSLVNSNMPLNQARQAIADFVDLLNGKRDALNKVHQQIMGGDAAIIDKEENSMITKKAHDRNNGIQAAAPAAGSISEGATATNRQTGQRVIRKGGQWVPMQ